MRNLLSIKDVVEPIRGGYWGETADREAANARIVRNGDISENADIGKDTPHRKLTESELERARVRRGDVLITVSGNVGRVAFVREEYDEDGTPYAASNFVKILRAKQQKISPEFLLFFLRSRPFIENLKRHTRGVAIQNLSSQAFEEKILSLPNIASQKAAAAMLEEAEILRQKRAAANTKMEELTSAIFQGIFGAAGTWPTKFKMRPLGEVVNIASGSTPSKQRADYWNGKIPWVSAKDMKRPFIEDSIDHLTELALSETNVAAVKEGSVLIVVRGMILARYVPICMAGCELTINQDLKALYPKSADILGVYLWGALQNSAPHLFRLIKTAAHGTKKLDTVDLLQYKIPVPPLELQQKFAQRVEEVRGYIKQQEKSTGAIDELFHTLLERTFTHSDEVDESRIHLLRSRTSHPLQRPPARSHADRA